MLRRCKGAGAASLCVIVMFDVLFPCDCAPTLKEERRFFYPVEFIFDVTSWYACQNLPVGECARWRQAPKHLFRAESFILGGVLLRIMMLAEQYVLLKNINYRGGKKAFFPGGVHFTVTSWHARQNLPAGECARWRRARQSICFVLSLFFLGGGLVEDHDVGGAIICSA